jgi:hypothetical protein
MASTFTSTYQATARNVSPATLAAAMLAAVPALDPSVPVDKMGLAFSVAGSLTVGGYNAQLTIAYVGAANPDAVGDFANLWTRELAALLDTPVRFIGLVIT